jgi:hypothetical protein
VSLQRRCGMRLRDHLADGTHFIWSLCSPSTAPILRRPFLLPPDPMRAEQQKLLRRGTRRTAQRVRKATSNGSTCCGASSTSQCPVPLTMMPSVGAYTDRSAGFSPLRMRPV